MKKLTILIIMSALLMPACAQQQAGQWSIIPKVGLTLSKVSNDNILVSLNGKGLDTVVNSKYKPGFVAGVDVQYQVNHLLACSLGLYYQQEGERFDDITFTDGGQPTEALGSHKLTLGYLAMPLMAHAYVAQGLAFSVGLQPAFLTNADGSYETSTITVDEDGHPTYSPPHDEEYDVKHICNSFNLSVPVGVSYEFQNVVLAARYNIPLTKTFKSSYGDGRNSTFLFTVGYRIGL